jgi:putative tryptophan/tyrosine transport system substrate-binding protein
MKIDFRRRDFIVALGSAVAWPLAARAQQRPPMPVVGFLSTRSSDGSEHLLTAFLEGLSETGYTQAKNVTIEYRWAENQNDRLPTLVADLLNRRVTIIAAVGGSPAALAAKTATTTIPIVFQVGVDPVEFGLVASLNRPGGNLTGVTTLAFELTSKRLEVLHEMVPTRANIAVLINPTNITAEAMSKDLQSAARALGLRLHFLHANSESDFDTVFATLVRQRVDALVIAPDALFTNRSEQLAHLAVRYALPTIYQWHEFAAAGGLISYGASSSDSYRQAGVYSGRILHGAKPADLPVQQATKVELIINLKTAKTLGITVPISLLGRADEVIG